MQDGLDLCGAIDQEIQLVLKQNCWSLCPVAAPDFSLSDHHENGDRVSLVFYQ